MVQSHLNLQDKQLLLLCLLQKTTICSATEDLLHSFTWSVQIIGTNKRITLQALESRDFSSSVWILDEKLVYLE